MVQQIVAFWIALMVPVIRLRIKLDSKLMPSHCNHLRIISIHLCLLILNTLVLNTNQASYEGFQPSDSHQSTYKGLEQSTDDPYSSMGYQSGYTGSTTYTGHQGFKPFTSNQSWSKGFRHSSGQEVGYKGFVPSTGYQTGFEPPSKDHQVSHMAYEPSTNRGYGSFVPTDSMYKEQTHADSVAHLHLPNNYGGTHSSGDFSQQLSVGPNGPSQQFGFSPHEQRSSAGRPPHALVTFGFGGKLIVLKEISSITANFDSRNQVC
jgi:COPII coat assembly protein SEC16